jgi:hypothetical protein
MKAIYWVLTGLMFIFLLCIFSIGSAYVAYTLIPPQVVEKQVVVERYSTIEVPKIIEKQVFVTQEVPVLVTPVVTEIVQLPQPTVENTPLPPLKTCRTVVYVESRTKDLIQGDALKVNQNYRLTVNLYNAPDSCTLDGYTLTADSPDPRIPPINIAVPYTLPGQQTGAFIVTEGLLKNPLSYMIVLRDETGTIVPFVSGGTLQGCISWRVDSISKTPGFNQNLFSTFSGRLVCGAGG